jgi:hypothetical protein
VISVEPLEAGQKRRSEAPNAVEAAVVRLTGMAVAAWIAAP